MIQNRRDFLKAFTAFCAAPVAWLRSGKPIEHFQPLRVTAREAEYKDFQSYLVEAYAEKYAIWLDSHFDSETGLYVGTES